jgi:hypothetical protein
MAFVKLAVLNFTFIVLLAGISYLIPVQYHESIKPFAEGAVCLFFLVSSFIWMKGVYKTLCPHCGVRYYIPEPLRCHFYDVCWNCGKEFKLEEKTK